MNSLLSDCNKAIRKERPLDDHEMVITQFKRGNLLQLTFHTVGCRYSSQGTCSMCNYGQGLPINPNLVMNELKKICLSNDYLNSKMVLLGASGSFLDDYEISNELQIKIMEYISHTHIEEVFIETHFKSITESKLQTIKEIFVDKQINIEMGLETITTIYQKEILNKTINLTALDRTIKLIKSQGIGVSLNVLLGIPFLSLSEQIKDTNKTITWATEHGADYIVIFPINIQPYTLFEWWYNREIIKQTSTWLLVYLLNSLTDEELSKICLAWFGNRNIEYSSLKKTITPYSCPKCNNELLSFFENFTSDFNGKKRKQKLQELLDYKFACNCKEQIIKSINEDRPICDIEFAHSLLTKWRYSNGNE